MSEDPYVPGERGGGLRHRVRVAFVEDVDRTHASLLCAWTSFVVTFGLLRLITWAIHHGRLPLHDVHAGGLHIHHYVWGIALLLLVGFFALVADDPRWHPWLGLAYGAGAALVIDEYALLLNLRDVYWAREGRWSVDVALGVIGLLGTYLTAATFWRDVAHEVRRSVDPRVTTIEGPPEQPR